MFRGWLATSAFTRFALFLLLLLLLPFVVADDDLTSRLKANVLKLRQPLQRVIEQFKAVTDKDTEPSPQQEESQQTAVQAKAKKKVLLKPRSLEEIQRGQAEVTSVGFDKAAPDKQSAKAGNKAAKKSTGSLEVLSKVEHEKRVRPNGRKVYYPPSWKLSQPLPQPGDDTLEWQKQMLYELAGTDLVPEDPDFLYGQKPMGSAGKTKKKAEKDGDDKTAAGDGDEDELSDDETDEEEKEEEEEFERKRIGHYDYRVFRFEPGLSFNAKNGIKKGRQRVLRPTNIMGLIAGRADYLFNEDYEWDLSDPQAHKMLKNRLLVQGHNDKRSGALLLEPKGYVADGPGFDVLTCENAMLDKYVRVGEYYTELGVLSLAETCKGPFYSFPGTGDVTKKYNHNYGVVPEQLGCDKHDISFLRTRYENLPEKFGCLAWVDDGNNDPDAINGPGTDIDEIFLLNAYKDVPINKGKTTGGINIEGISD